MDNVHADEYKMPNINPIIGCYFDADSPKFVAEQNARVHIHNHFGSVDGDEIFKYLHLLKTFIVIV